MKKQHEKEAVRELDLRECQQVGGGLLSPEQDISEFPVWALPRIRFALNAEVIAAKTAQIG